MISNLQNMIKDITSDIKVNPVRLKRKVGRPSKVFLATEALLQSIHKQYEDMFDAKLEEMLTKGYSRITEEDLNL